MNKTKMTTALAAARAITDKAKSEGRDLTPAEVDTAQKHLHDYEAAKTEPAPDREKESDLTRRKLAEIGLHLGDGVDLGEEPQLAAGNFMATRAKSWGRVLHDKFTERSGGVKSLISGTIDVPSIIAEPVEILGTPQSILQLIPTRARLASSAQTGNPGNSFSFLKQTVRTNNASSVLDGATKPVSGATFAEVVDTFHVYAHTTDPLPARYLDDYGQLISILEKQLGEGLLKSLESDILNGTGVPTATTDPITGITATSGTLVEVFDTDALKTLSNARYTLTDTGVMPTAWVMNSRDVQAFELMREGGNTGALLFGSGRTTLRQYLGDYPIITSALMPQGTALLGDFNETELIIREDDHLDIDKSGTLFTKNQVLFRHEGRYGFAVLRPAAFIEVDLVL